MVFAKFGKIFLSLIFVLHSSANMITRSIVLSVTSKNEWPKAICN